MHKFTYWLAIVDWLFYYWAKINVRQPFEPERQVLQSSITIAKTKTYGIVWMENIWSRAVVHDDHFVQVPAEPAKVLDVAATVEHARLAEQACSKHAPLVQQVRHRVGILQHQSVTDDYTQ